MSKPKVRRGWTPHPKCYGIHEGIISLRHLGVPDEAPGDVAACVMPDYIRGGWKWDACDRWPDDGPQLRLPLPYWHEHGHCDTIEQAKAAAEASLLAAGYEFEEG